MSSKEIIFFTIGDSNNASVWSNVPFCFSKALEQKDIVVYRVNISAPQWLVSFYNLFLRRLINILTIGKIHACYASKTHWFKIIAEKKIKKAAIKHSQADYCFFMGYGFYNKWNDIPSLLFSDWTFETDIKKRGKPGPLHCRAIRQEKEAIENSGYVISMFAECAEEMKKKYPNANIHFLGGNVINDLSGLRLRRKDHRVMSKDDTGNNKNKQITPDSLHLTPYTLHSSNEINVEDLLEKKVKSKKLLFIGRKTTYLEAAKKLIDAYKLLKREEDYKDFTLDIVGCAESDFDSLPEGVTCYGFLNKSEERDRKIYYGLLLNAKVLINPTPKWGAYSSTIEAMYNYTPVIVSPYETFVNEFGRIIDFGLYNEHYTAEGIAKDIEIVIFNNDYKSLCENAHNRVEKYTWSNYVDKVLNLIS